MSVMEYGYIASHRESQWQGYNFFRLSLQYSIYHILLGLVSSRSDCSAKGHKFKSQSDHAALPSLTRFACDTREYVFSHAYTQMNENHTRIGKLAKI